MTDTKVSSTTSTMISEALNESIPVICTPFEPRKGDDGAIRAEVEPLSAGHGTTTMMEAANALTALGDSDEVEDPVQALTDTTAPAPGPEPEPGPATTGSLTEYDGTKRQSATLSIDLSKGDQSGDKLTTTTTSEVNKDSMFSNPDTTPVSVKDEEQDDQQRFGGSFNIVNENNTSLSNASNHSVGTTTTTTTKTTTVTATTAASINTSTTGGGATTASGKRFIPEHKKPDAALTFPEKMMELMRFVDEHKDDPEYCAAWQPDGKSFIVRQPDEFARSVIPKYFKATKFSSFTRKLYRWGFRQINRGLGPDDPVIFGNEYFERDNEGLMSKMRSVTAAGTRKSESRVMTTTDHLNSMYGKRPFDTMNGSHPMMYDNFAEQQKRFMYEQFMQQQQWNMQQKEQQQLMQQQQQHQIVQQSSPSSLQYGGGGPIPMNQQYHQQQHLGSVGGSIDYPQMHNQSTQALHHQQHQQMMMPPAIKMQPDGSPPIGSMMTMNNSNMAYNPILQPPQQQQIHQSLPTQQAGGPFSNNSYMNSKAMS